MTGDPQPPQRPRAKLTVYPRGSEEFSRVLAFSDGLFAIAITLLVVGIAVPTLADPDSVGDLADALHDDLGSFISFVISFAVIGRYWIAHHAFFAQLAGIDDGLTGLNLVYLMFIAFLPFPTGLLGNYFENPLSIIVYAIAVAAVSGMEVVLSRHAYRRRLFSREMPEDVYRWGTLLSLSPVIFFCASVPVAFVNTGIAVAVWFLAIPFQILFDRRKPPRADEFF